jgi:hypothetical protein
MWILSTMSDETHFDLSGYVNKYDFRNWGHEQLMQVYEKPLHGAKVIVCCGMSAFGIIKPYFFAETSTNPALSQNRKSISLLKLKQLMQCYCKEL